MDGMREQVRRFNLLATEIDAAYHEATLKLGLSDSAMIILYTICLFEGACPLGDIVALSGLPKQTVNSALRKLEGEDVVYLEAEGRKKRVCLTEKGRGLAEKTALRIMEIENGIFASWTPEERETYLRLTRRYLAMLREEIQALK
ncbi:MarR family transcriptional regulator [Acutalibacter sp. JLR.KK004]|jgi:DNA-binding MarR family transcriptional regulator|uniref:MarR family winged helix-turn-helix transcriptional regulator n=1 Tax=Acutalibacter sp. JLR.KK004 TaxID=3112622 RepID=UPI00216F632E|nr:MarR family transcriptional regulator [Acutalibacter sp.]